MQPRRARPRAAGQGGARSGGDLARRFPEGRRPGSAGRARIVIHGPAKETALFDAGIASEALFVADSREDAEAILGRARAAGRTPRYLLRLSPRAALPSQRPFGLAAAELLAAAGEIRRRGAPLPRGLAFHLGTGIASIVPYLRAIGEAAATAALSPRSGSRSRCLTSGAGLPPKPNRA